MAIRRAIIRNNVSLDQVRAYMPSNYTAESVIMIQGADNAGWTLDGYVIPRLHSGMIFAVEVTETAE